MSLVLEFSPLSSPAQVEQGLTTELRTEASFTLVTWKYFGRSMVENFTDNVIIWTSALRGQVLWYNNWGNFACVYALKVNIFNDEGPNSAYKCILHSMLLFLFRKTLGQNNCLKNAKIYSKVVAGN